MGITYLNYNSLQGYYFKTNWSVEENKIFFGVNFVRAYTNIKMNIHLKLK